MIKTNFGEQTLAQILENNGLTNSFAELLDKASKHITDIADTLPGFAARADETADIEAMQAATKHIQANFTDLIIFGTGGSSLGAQAATAIARYQTPSGVTLHFPDSLDPFEMDLLFRTLDPAKTHVLAISKSGTTAETLSQMLTAKDWIQTHNKDADLSKQFTFITEPGERAMRTFAERLGSQVIDHPTDVGGRFSILTCVGMLPCMVAGQSVEAFRKGASDMLATALNDPKTSMPVVGAALAEAFRREKGATQVCLMPYAESLRSFTRWFGQLWAESLGKEGQGTTPLSAVGPVDQHSQLQLYLDGPDDKIYSFITVPSYKQGPVVSAEEATEFGLDYMAGRTIGDTVTCQSRATADTLRNRGRFVRDIEIDGLTEENLGGLFMSFMLETILAANLMQIDAYDQPAVEEGKILTRQYLSEL